GRRGRQVDREISGGLRYGCLYIRGGGIYVLVQRELQRQACVTLRAARGDELQSIDLHKLALQRRGDIIRHCVGARARVVHLHLNNRIIDSRKVVHRKPEITQGSEEDDRDG